MTGVEIYVLVHQLPTGPKVVYGSVFRENLENFLPPNLPPELKKFAIQTVPVLGLLYKAESYDAFAEVASDVMERYAKSGFGRPGEPNTFWAMTMAALDELDQLRKQVHGTTARPKEKKVDVEKERKAKKVERDSSCVDCGRDLFDLTNECASCHDKKYILVHADGGACHGVALMDVGGGSRRCPKCGITPDMQSTEFWPRKEVKA